MKIARKFTKNVKSPYDGFEYEVRKSRIRNVDGSSASREIQVEVPRGWSQVATDILAQKYLRERDVPQMDENGKPKVDENGKPVLGAERTVKQVVDRLAGCWADWGEKSGYFSDKQSAKNFYDEVAHMILNQMAAPNSPQWFNTGLHYRYGIKGNAQGHYYVDPKDNKVKKSTDAYTRPQPHACFIQSVDDDLLGENGIYSLLTREGRIFKYGSGTGTNFSSVRSSGEALGGGGASSGLMSFLKVYDRSAGAIKSGGTTRRAAKMVCLDLDHPEVEDFITWKSREEDKVAAMVAGSKAIKKHMNAILALGDPKQHSPEQKEKLLQIVRVALEDNIPQGSIKKALELAEQGVAKYEMEDYDTDYEGKAYETVSGQNSNNSIRVPDKFLTALQEDGDWELTSRLNGRVMKKVKARQLWDKIAYAAWACADPGLQMDDTINDWHTCPEDGRINGSNPCSEYMFLDDTACNLASLNLDKFVDEKGEFQIEEFEHAARLWTIVLEISVTMAQFPSPSVARKSYDYRTLGLGYANLGTVLMKWGIPYDSPRAYAITGAISAMLGGQAYAASAEMASELGAFDRYQDNSEHMLRVIRNHRRAAYNEEKGRYEKLTVTPQGIDEKHCPVNLLQAARASWDRALDLGEKHGYRNAQVTVIAPTGTIGLIMDCDTTGIEPDFALIKFKKLAGGGYFKIVNQSVAPALQRLGYLPNQIDDIIFWCKGTGTLKNAPHINPETLAEKGFKKTHIQAIEDALPTTMELYQAFSPFNLGPEFLHKLGFSEEEIFSEGFSLLHALGFTDQQIDDANVHICGAQTIEGAPHLKMEHYPIFDCANTCGPRGTRSIAAQAHLRVMSAAQPFISGAISKTVNLPASASVQDIKNIYMESWSLMIKAIALYRDGCKLSQPLSSANKASEIISQASTLELQSEPSVIPEKEKIVHKLQRRRLPTRRAGFTQEVTISGHKLFLRTGEYPDGSLGEIFIDMYKEGASYRGILNCFAVLSSKALQYGVPLEELVETFTFTRFEPSGPVDGHPNIKTCTSILDMVFRTLGLTYNGKTDFVHIKPISDSPDVNKEGKDQPDNDAKQDEPPAGEKDKPVPASVTKKSSTGSFSTLHKAYEASRRAGYTGESCSSCGSVRVRRNGTCTLCDDCGSTSGCS